MFELGSVAHKYYIVNLWFPKHDDNNLCLTGKGNHVISGLHFTVSINDTNQYSIILVMARHIGVQLGCVFKGLPVEILSVYDFKLNHTAK